MKKLSQKDLDIALCRSALFLKGDAPKAGDYIRFADGTLRRIAYVWPDGAQTTDKHSNSFYLGDGYMSYSGGLYRSTPMSKIVNTGETMEGEAWFFHNDHQMADNGVWVTLACKVWATSEMPNAI